MNKLWFISLFGSRSVKCQEIAEPPLDEEDMDPETEERLEQRGGYIPPLSTLMNPIKMMTLGYPGVEINGFKFSLGSGLSNNFLISHEFQLSPKKQTAQTGNPMMDMFAEKTPFYTLNLQYHHGVITPTQQKINFSVVGRTDSTGRLDAIFVKTLGSLKAKIHSSFMNNNIMYSNTQLELENQGKNTKQVLGLSSQAISYSLLERLGPKILAGVEATYVVPKKNLLLGWAFRVSPRNGIKYYFQNSPAMGGILLGSQFSIGEGSSAVLEMDFGSIQKQSSASLGFQRKSKNYKVNTAIRSDGDIKSIFTFSTIAYKLRLFLGGNLWNDDFRAGYAFSFGQTDD